MAEQGSALSSASGRTVDQTLHVDAAIPAWRQRRPAPRRRRDRAAAADRRAGRRQPGRGHQLPGSAACWARPRNCPAPRRRWPAIPGQVARFGSARLAGSLLIAGASTVRLSVTARHEHRRDPVRRAARRRRPDGTDVLPAEPRRPVAADRAARRACRDGHRPTARRRREPCRPATGSGSPWPRPTWPTSCRPTRAATPWPWPAPTAPLSVPTVTGHVAAARATRWPGCSSASAVAVAGSAAAVGVRAASGGGAPSRPTPRWPTCRSPIAGLVKEYGDGYRAVDGVTLPGRAGPGRRPARPERRRQDDRAAGAGRADHADARARSTCSAQPVTPGAPVLARIGAFIEGPGLPAAPDRAREPAAVLGRDRPAGGRGRLRHRAGDRRARARRSTAGSRPTATA